MVSAPCSFLCASHACNYTFLSCILPLACACSLFVPAAFAFAFLHAHCLHDNIIVQSPSFPGIPALFENVHPSNLIPCVSLLLCNAPSPMRMRIVLARLSSSIIPSHSVLSMQFRLQVKSRSVSANRPGAVSSGLSLQLSLQHGSSPGQASHGRSLQTDLGLEARVCPCSMGRCVFVVSSCLRGTATVRPADGGVVGSAVAAWRVLLSFFRSGRRAQSAFSALQQWRRDGTVRQYRSAQFVMSSWYGDVCHVQRRRMVASWAVQWRRVLLVPS